ncbi:histidine kinase [Segetibacter sp.]|jgi:two-component system LytT family sensor kinase|uniref:sensor histidine kinase n=1 Tax=Segetibacter sp. TaxID=2231182 RepID=UPI00261BED17|nr:histidine kinase [Segetibacter sp.]MCW3081341.1 autolysin sensor kinase [Segetibacter sp.]
MNRSLSKYWLCQIGGWSTYIIVFTFFYLTLRTKEDPNFFKVLFLDAFLGIGITHLMRSFIQRVGLLKLRLDNQITYMILTTVGFSFFLTFASIYLEDTFNLTNETFRQHTLVYQTIKASFSSFIFLIIWNLIYFTYHYVIKSQQEQLDKVKLQSLVKELELKTIKAHINPHFIFNALNSIRALVDENPQRARQAITELSNLLRSSMQAEKVETTPLSKELNIVRDYLALEHIRFEDRLNIEYDIDEDTLGQPVPPMMLQTLVENAIKHGISKKMEGGIIKIISDFKDNYHELTVTNTGHLNGDFNPDGFGLSSTQSRLMLLYGDKAHFEIKNKSENMVEATVKMPVA